MKPKPGDAEQVCESQLKVQFIVLASLCRLNPRLGWELAMVVAKDLVAS